MAARARSRPCCRRSAALNHDLSDPSLAPASFGPFRVLHQIGVGVLGPVYRAQDSVRDQLVAVKVFKVDAPPEQAEQMADALQAVVHALPRHNGLIELIAAGVEHDTAYLVMAHSDVLSLDTQLKPGVPLDAEEALGIIRALADAMDAAHARGIVHGGLHPRDVFVDERGGCRAAGFGVATALARAGVRVPVRRPYSPPERLTSAPIEPAADRFALGALAFELLSGRRIVGTGASAAARCPVPPDADPEADVEKLQTALAAMLAEQPAHRPSTAAAFAQALTQALFPHGISRGVGATIPSDRRSAAAPDDRHGDATVAGAALAMPAGEADGPSRDDLERFTRQGTLWESKPPDEQSWDELGRSESSPNGAPRREPSRGEGIRWETVETVAQGEDPLALFAPESPSPEPTFFAPPSESASTRGASGPVARAAGAASAAAAPAETMRGGTFDRGARDERDQREDTTTADETDERWEPRRESWESRESRESNASASATASATDEAARAPSRSDSILGLSAPPPSSSAFVDEDRDRVADSHPADASDEVHDEDEAFATGAHATRTHDVDTPQGTYASPILRLDSELWSESSARHDRGPGLMGDEPSSHRDVELPIAAAAAAGAAAASARARYDRDAAAERGAARPVVAPAAARSTPSAPFADTSEPADVGSPVRVIGLVLALGLAVGGAGGYLLGQRSALRGPSAIDQPTATTGARAPAADTAVQPSAPPSGTGRAPADAQGATPQETRADRAGSSANAARRGAEPASTASPATSASGAPAPLAGAVDAARSTTAGGSRPAALGRLTITSTPSPAEIAIDGTRRGATPLTIRDLPLGSHTVRVTRTGYAPETRRVTLAAANPTSALVFELEPTGRRVPSPPAGIQAATSARGVDTAPPARGSASGLGSLSVASRPVGAQVKVDGRLVGSTPLLLTDVSSGAHTVQIEAPRHKSWTTTVQVAAGQRVRVGASLEEEP